MNDEKGYGLIYGLTNPYFKGLVKIGATRNLDINKRMAGLGTAVPVPFECAFAYKVPHEVLFSIEHTLHDTFDYCRIKGGEFFRIEPYKVDNLLRKLGKFEPMKSTVQNAISAASEAQIEKAERRKSPNMDFLKMGLSVGDKLIFSRDRSIVCTIVSNKMVNYNGANYSLTKLTHMFVASKYIVRPAPYWETEDGTPLMTLYISYAQKQAGELQEQLAANAASSEAVIAECEKIS